MFVPKSFEVDDPAFLAKVMAAHDFALLVNQREDAPFVTHIPLLHDPDDGPYGTIHGHVARANPHWRCFDGAATALAVFQGPHAYISPSWYPSTEKVPTWNYVAVHAYGRPALVDDPDAVRAHLSQMVSRQENQRSDPWSMDDLPDRYIEGMLRGLVAFRMPIDRLQGKAKMNQNHPIENRRGAAAGLRATGRADDTEVARLIDRFDPDRAG